MEGFSSDVSFLLSGLKEVVSVGDLRDCVRENFGSINVVVLEVNSLKAELTGPCMPSQLRPTNQCSFATAGNELTLKQKLPSFVKQYGGCSKLYVQTYTTRVSMYCKVRNWETNNPETMMFSRLH